MANAVSPTTVSNDDLNDLKARVQSSEEDLSKNHNDYSLKRYLKAFKTVNSAYQAILRTNKWRSDYKTDTLSLDHPDIKKHHDGKKAMVLKHRDLIGRPVIYIPAKFHNINDRNIDELTKFIVYCLEEACKKCFEEVIDNLCIVFDLKDFGLSCMDYQIVKNLIWLLSRHYPERLGVCLILNSPPLFNTCWAVIKGWLDENTSSKVLFVYSEEELCKYLIPDILPNV